MGFPRQDHWSGLPLPSLLIPLNKHQLAEKLLCGPWQNIHKLIYLMVMGGVHYGGQNYWSERQQHSQFPHLPKLHARSVFLETRRSARLKNLGWRNQHPQNLVSKKSLQAICIFKIYCKFISGLSILFHWSIFPFLCLYHSVLITVAL